MNTSENQDPIVVYGHRVCPMVAPIKALFEQSKVPYTYINIHEDAAGRDFVKATNNGYESVPTLLFPDNSTLTEPSVAALRAKLERMGYEVSAASATFAKIWKYRFVIAALLLVALIILVNNLA